MEALYDVVKAGKARDLGASAIAAWQFATAQQLAERHGWTRFVSMQHRYNLLDREVEREMIPLCRDQGVALLPYSPLARGLLAAAGQTTRARSDPLPQPLRPSDTEIVAAVSEIAFERAASAAQVALAWLLHHPGVAAPLIGATKLDHLDGTLAAATLELSPEELDRLERSYVARWLNDAPSADRMTPADRGPAGGAER